MQKQQEATVKQNLCGHYCLDQNHYKVLHSPNKKFNSPLCLKQSIRENKEKWQRALLVFLTKNFQTFGRVDKNLSNFLSDLNIQMFYSVETKRLLIWKCQRHQQIITRIITSKWDNFSKSDKNLPTFVSTLGNF